MNDVLFQLGIAFTIGHVLCDLLNAREHMREPRCILSLLAVVFLLGHVILTGELGEWWGKLI